ncbi:FAD/NAD(P)-binding domain containing protein [Hyaloscypha variabilis]
MGDVAGEHTNVQYADPVLTIGSGCIGLAIAQGLKKAGIPVIVFEKNAAVFSPGERDWNMGLHWGLPTLKSLISESAAAQLQSVQVDPNTPTKPIDSMIFLNGLAGERMTAIEIPNFHRLRRSKLRALLSKGLDIRWNKKLRDIVYESDGKAMAVFEDGETATGRSIIGTDGRKRRSRRDCHIRQHLFTREQALHFRSFHSLYIAADHPAGTFAFFGLQDAPEVDKPEDWTFFFYISWNSSLEQQDEERKNFGNKDAFEWVPEDQPCWYFDLAVWDPSLPAHNWDNKNGRVTLAGDAAHPMTYQRGQGLNHSITDVGKLVGFLALEADQKLAIDKYEDEMKARAGEEVQISVMNTAMLHDWEKVMKSPLMKAGLRKGT